MKNLDWRMQLKKKTHKRDKNKNLLIRRMTTDNQIFLTKGTALKF
jgi:hypothetical protein